MAEITAADFGLLEYESETEGRVYGRREPLPTYQITEDTRGSLLNLLRSTTFEYDVIDRAAETARQEIPAEVDAEIFAALDQIEVDQITVPMARRLVEGAQDEARGSTDMADALRRYVARWS